MTTAQQNITTPQQAADDGWQLLQELRGFLHATSQRRLEVAQQAQLIAEKSQNKSLQIESLLWQSRELPIEQSEAVITQAKSLSETTGDVSSKALCSCFYALLERRRGAPLKALMLLKEVTAKMLSNPDPYMRYWPKYQLAYTLIMMGLHKLAKPLVEEVLSECRGDDIVSRLYEIEAKELNCFCDGTVLLEKYSYAPIPADDQDGVRLVRNFEEVINQLKAPEQTRPQIVAAFNFIETLIICSQYERALAYLDEMEASSGAWNKHEHELVFLELRALLTLRHERNGEKAAEIYRRLLNEPVLTEMPHVNRDLWRRLSEAYSLSGDYQEAFQAQATYHRLQSQHASQVAQTEATLIGMELQAEREKLQAQQALVHAGKLVAVGQLASSLAHELSQPAGTLLLLSQQAQILLQQSFQPSTEGKSNAEAPAKLTDVLGHIQVQADRLSQLVRRMNNFARKELINPSILQLKAVVEQAEALYMPRLKAQGVSYHCDIPESIFIRGDTERLTLVLVNLIANALDALQGQISPAPEIRLSVDTTDAEYLQLHVGDNGPGLNEEAKARLFEPFYTTKPAGQGLGLGLAIATEAMSEIQGQLYSLAQTPDSGGAVFVLELVREGHARGQKSDNA